MKGLPAPHGGESRQHRADRQPRGLTKDARPGSGRRAGHFEPSGLVRPLELAAPAACSIVDMVFLFTSYVPR
jgi:hypothetical protein